MNQGYHFLYLAPEHKKTHWKRSRHTHIHVTLGRAKIGKQLKHPTGLVNQEFVACIEVERYAAIKRQNHALLSSWVELEKIALNKIGQKERNKH